MKKWMAAALSASMMASAFPVAALAEDTAVDVLTDEVMFVLTAEGESLTASITVDHTEDGDVSISAGVTLPAAMMGEEMTVTLDDIVRVADGDAYLNAELVMNLYQELTGDTTLTMLATMVGINQPWIVIPAIEGLAAEDETVVPEISEELAAALADCFASFEPVEDNGVIEIEFDGTHVVELVKSLNALGNDYGEELEALIMSSMAEDEGVNYTEILSDYILAAAEGLNTVDPTMSVEDTVAMFNQAIEAAMQSTTTDVDVFGTIAPEEVDEVIAGMEEYLNADTLQGLITMDETGLVFELGINDGEETVEVMAAWASGMVSELTEITAPEAATPLRDVVKNVVIIYYSMMMQESAE